jgi:large subunit ribosomal protein L29
MKMIEITEMSDKQLKEKLAEETTTLTKLRLAHAVFSLDNPTRIRNSRKTIARINTEVRKRALTNSSNNQ